MRTEILHKHLYYINFHATYPVGTLLLPSHLVNSNTKMNYENEGSRAQTCVLICARPKPIMLLFNENNSFFGTYTF